MASPDAISSSRVAEAAPLLNSAESVSVKESKSNGRMWKVFAVAAIPALVTAVCIVALAALMVPQVTAAVGLTAGGLMIANISLAVVGTLGFIGTILVLSWGAKPAASPKAEEKPAEAPSAEIAAPAAAPAAAESDVAPVTARVPSPTDDMPGRADAALDQLKEMKRAAGI